MRIFLAILFSFTLNVKLFATTAVFNERCLQAQDKIYNLQLSGASTLLTLEQSQNPSNITASYLWVIHDLLKVLVSESPESFTQFNKQAENAIKAVNTYTGNDGYGDFFKEEIHFYSSVVHAKAGNSVAAANEIRLCYKYGEKLLKEHPDFLPAYKTMGLIHSGFGNLPTSYRKLVSMLGYSGSTEKGIEELQTFIQSKNSKPEWIWLKREAGFYLSAVHLYLKNDQSKAWTMVETLTSNHTANPLLIFVRANFADKCKKNDLLISILQKAPHDASYESVPYFDFLLGTAKMQRLDKDASIYLLRFLTTTKGKSYIKSTYQKLAWHALVSGDNSSYLSYQRKVLLNGNVNLEEDQQAQMEAASGQILDSRLLKARLLFDGGYYEKGLVVIQNLKADDFSSTLLKTEYCYRKARLYHQLKDYAIAEVFYKAAMVTGASLSVYYASYAALYLAELYEVQGKIELARTYYQKATQFKSNKEYKNSIEHRAKAGLLRLK